MATASQPDEMVFIGKTKILKMIKDTGWSREKIAKEVGLSKGGLYYVTHKSGKMNVLIWKEFKKFYEKQTGKKVDIDESKFSDAMKAATKNQNVKKKPKISESKNLNLQEIAIEELIAEIKRRGGVVTF
jgi:benzoyl-CoA reductase/2-hydroxyglutaryl-CoA dehydratase subunit BcrC/BadD/HgdB